VEDASRITVKLTSGEEYQATVVGVDPETDLAVLKIDAGRDLPFIKLGNSEATSVGDWVLAIGSPFGLTRTVTAGIISQTRRETPGGSPFQKFIQTDAAINRGNSGGPLVNMSGEVIGVNSQIATSTGDYNGVGFALPANEVRVVYDQIVKSGKVRRGFLGVVLDSVKPEYAAVYKLPEAKGAIITDVRANLSAAAAGLISGDVIVKFNDAKIESAQDLIAKVSSAGPDQTVTIEYLRESGDTFERKTASIKLGSQPENETARQSNATGATPPAERARQEQKPFGLTLTELTPAVASTYKLDARKGVVVKEINPESFIADVKMSNGADAMVEGDVIIRLNRMPITDAKSFSEAAAKLRKGDPVVLHVLQYVPSARGAQLKIVQFTVQ
ncbi:MAG: trypsin-like peptidase domain-containing protein, partial [Acidobacteria bacterium]|nr:trypsin-like peptidase domain-containing protein [Acidobacteriota bacterium]